MSKATKNRKYDLDFKIQVVKMVTEQGLSQMEVGRRLGLHHTLVSTWVRKFKKEGSKAFPGKGHQTPEQEEVRQLRAELRRVTLERDILKKTMTLFVEPLK